MKIGILTHYYNSTNYGGVLQAYALTKVLRGMGYDAEQICFSYYDWHELNANCINDSQRQNAFSAADQEKKNCSGLQSMYSGLKKAVWARTKGRIRRETERKRQIAKDIFITPRFASFTSFRDFIPHSDKVYSVNTLFMVNEIYDAFITGSDQVWNFVWHNPSFFLEFADKDKKKIAYAASAGASEFDMVQKKYLSRVLPRFDAVSVREENLVGTYKDIAGVHAEYVLDPVMLLTAEDWDEIASDRLIDEKYIFCFFYNPISSQYELIKQFAEKKGLKIALIPYAMGGIQLTVDDDFGDYRMGAASPVDFISLIKNAEYVFTDSFHATVYSLIYQKQFFTFVRNYAVDMNSRITALSKLFDCEDRFCATEDKMRIEYLSGLKQKEYSDLPCKHNELRERSISFLINALKA